MIDVLFINVEDKGKARCRGNTPEKEYPTGELVIKWWRCAALFGVYRRATVISE